jgi:hypothetical protein
MIKSYFVLFLSILSFSCFAQFTYFNNRYNNNAVWSSALTILETDAGYLSCGVSGEISQGYIFKRIVLAAIDDYGNQVWWKTYGEDFHNYYAGERRAFIRTMDGGYALSGTIEDSIIVVGHLMRFNPNGDSLWSRVYGDTVPGYHHFTSFLICKELADKGFLISGYVGVSGDDGDIILIRTDSLGNVIWQHTYGQLHWIEAGSSIVILPEGKFLIGIMKQSINIFNSMDPGLLKVDSLGNQIWIKYYGGTYDDCGFDVTLSQDGNYICGSALGIAEPYPEIPMVKNWIFEADTSGNIIWQKLYGDQPYGGGGCTTIDELSDGSLIASGYGGFADVPGLVGWILKTKQNGDSIWMRRYSYYPDFTNLLSDIQITSDNGIILTGEVYGDPEWVHSFWIQKLDSIGCDYVKCDTTVWIKEEYPGMEAWGHANLEVWPNPAREVLHFNLSCYQPIGYLASGKSDKFSIEVYDLLGKLIYTVRIFSSILETSSAGWSMDVSSLQPGIYLVALKNGDSILDFRKFVIAR